MLLTRREIKAIREAVETAAAPMTASEVCKKVVGGKKRSSISLCETALKDLVEQGTAFEHSPIRSGYPARYWHKDGVSRVVAQIERIVADAPDPPTISQVKAKIAKADLLWFDEAVGRLINQSRLFEVSLKRARRLLCHRPKPENLLSETDIRDLNRVIRKTESCRQTDVKLHEILRFLETGSGEVPTGPRSPTLTESLLRQWYDEELPALRGATSVPLPSTWDRYKKWCVEKGAEPDLSALHDILQQLSQDGIVELVPHSRSHPIHESEHPVLMKGSHGETIYFWRWRKRTEK